MADSRELVPLSSLIQANDPVDGGVGVTAVTKFKHADLWRAAKKVGNVASLARYLGVSSTTLGGWVNLRSCPPATPRGWWSEDRLAMVEGKLLVLTGKTWEELFPSLLRKNVAFLNSNKTLETTAYLEDLALTHYAIATEERMKAIAAPDLDNDELKSELSNVLSVLTPRQRQAVCLYFGVGADASGSHDYVGVAKAMDISNARSHQLVDEAIRRMQGSGVAQRLTQFLDQLD